MLSKQLEAGRSSDIYDAAVAGMKKATRLNHNAAATRKPSCPQSFDGPASLGALFQNENKSLSNESILLQSRSTKNGLSPSNKQRSIARDDEKQANIDIVWPSVRVSSNYPIEPDACVFIIIWFAFWIFSFFNSFCMWSSIVDTLSIVKCKTWKLILLVILFMRWWKNLNLDALFGSLRLATSKCSKNFKCSSNQLWQK